MEESLQMRTDVRLLNSVNASKSAPSVTSGWRSPTYSDAGAVAATVGGTAIVSGRAEPIAVQRRENAGRQRG